LVVSLGTIKTHINHIYQKLDVRSRTQAVARARELNLV
jgi:LuxR family maltose regulon positive regulatory protein